MPENSRDYAHYIHRLTAIEGVPAALQQTGQVDAYPLYQITLATAATPDWVLLTAGVHGDEPAGPEAVWHFLQRDNRALYQRFNFLILPCINPYGYEHNTRDNARGADLNRSFEKDTQAEVRLVKAVTQNRRFCCTIDLHEDWEATGFYLYEARRNAPLMGEALLRQVETIGPIDTDTEGDENDVAIAPGLYPVPVAWGTQGLVPYLYQFHTDHALNPETPTQWPLDQRAAAQLKLVDSVLQRHALADP